MRDLNEWLAPVDNLFVSGANFSTDLANNGQGIAFLFVFFVAVVIAIFILIKLKNTGWKYFR